MLPLEYADTLANNLNKINTIFGIGLYKYTTGKNILTDLNNN